MKNENASPVPRVTGHYREGFPGGLIVLMRRAMHHTRKQFARNQGPSERLRPRNEKKSRHHPTGRSCRDWGRSKRLKTGRARSGNRGSSCAAATARSASGARGRAGRPCTPGDACTVPRVVPAIWDRSWASNCGGNSNRGSDSTGPGTSTRSWVPSTGPTRFPPRAVPGPTR